MTIDEAIHLESHDQQWADRFSDELQTLTREIGPIRSPSNISTSVPGMTAKPIVKTGGFCDSDEAIHLESYDQQWADRFSDELQTLTREIGPMRAPSNISRLTSVPGTAKPIVDILVGVENAAHSNEIIP